MAMVRRSPKTADIEEPAIGETHVIYANAPSSFLEKFLKCKDHMVLRCGRNPMIRRMD